jgi:hypothetical protein
MIGIFKGSHVNLQRSNRGFVVLHHELLPFLKQFTGSEWLVLTCLALRADETGYSFPSVSLICDDTGLSERIVRQAIKTLSTATVERPKAVLSVEERHVESGRRTTNGYVILPDGFGEGAKTAREEGAKNAGVITLKNIHKEVDTPIVPTKGTKRDSIKMPVDDDPSKALFIAYRSVIHPAHATAFLLGEWRGAHHVLRSMQGAGITPEQVTFATQNLLKKWGKPNLVTINSLWKHWTTAITDDVQQNTISNAVSMVDKLWD